MLDLEHARERNVTRHPSGDETVDDLGTRDGGSEVLPDPRRPLGREDVHFFAGVFFALAAGLAEAEADAVVAAVADAVAEAVVVVAGVDAVVAVEDGIPVSDGIADEPVLDGMAESVGGVWGGFG